MLTWLLALLRQRKTSHSVISESMFISPDTIPPTLRTLLVLCLKGFCCNIITVLMKGITISLLLWSAFVIAFFYKLNWLSFPCEKLNCLRKRFCNNGLRLFLDVIIHLLSSLPCQIRRRNRISSVLKHICHDPEKQYG